MTIYKLLLFTDIFKIKLHFSIWHLNKFESASIQHWIKAQCTFEFNLNKNKQSVLKLETIHMKYYFRKAK